MFSGILYTKICLREAKNLPRDFSGRPVVKTVLSTAGGVGQALLGN